MSCHLYVVNYLTTLRAIAAFGDRPIDDILADFPLKTITQKAFTDFMVQIRTLTLHLKAIAQEEQLKSTTLQTPVRDNYLEYLPNNAEETNQFCANFDAEAIKRSGRVGLRGWTTEFDKQVDKIKASNAPHMDPLLGKTIATPVSGGDRNSQKFQKYPTQHLSQNIPPTHLTQKNLTNLLTRQNKKHTARSTPQWKQ